MWGVREVDGLKRQYERQQFEPVPSKEVDRISI
jgi:hypothetical protein